MQEKRGIHTIDNQNFSYHVFNPVTYQEYKAKPFKKTRMKWKKENKTKVENGNPLSETPTPTPTSPPQ
ncbi:hypothetical protein Avbf_09172 [Armadillidium vulgare]|nr:hypothetical protein Avbf_09172 [Armadillidium vulgare]